MKVHVGLSPRGITEILKRPLDQFGEGHRRYFQESLQQIADALERQIETLDARSRSASSRSKSSRTVTA